MQNCSLQVLLQCPCLMTLCSGRSLSKLVAFDTNVYMSDKVKDTRVIAQVLRAWSLIAPSILILVPIVSSHNPLWHACLCVADARSRQPWTLSAVSWPIFEVKSLKVC